MSWYVCGWAELELPAAGAVGGAPGVDPVSAFAGETIASAKTNFASGESVAAPAPVVPVVPVVPVAAVPVVPAVAAVSAPAGGAALRHPVTMIFCSADGLVFCCGGGVCAVAATAAPAMIELHVAVQIVLIISPPARGCCNCRTPRCRRMLEVQTAFFRTHESECHMLASAGGPQGLDGGLSRAAILLGAATAAFARGPDTGCQAPVQVALIAFTRCEHRATRRRSPQSPRTAPRPAASRPAIRLPTTGDPQRHDCGRSATSVRLRPPR